MRLEPIGIIHSAFKEPAGTPIQPCAAGGAAGTIELYEPYVAGLQDLIGFERIWVLYWFNRAPEWRLKVVPFLDSTERGLFATRAPCRPNPIGLSSVRLLAIEGNVLHVGDVDILDGTPLLDIKPYVPRFDCFTVGRCGWIDHVSDDRETADDRFDGAAGPADPEEATR